MAETQPLNIMIVAGEASGDMHAAALMRALRRFSPRPARFFGLGGPEMRREGAELVHDIDRLAVMGFWEVFRDLGFFRRLLREMTQRLERERPDLLLTIDYPGFNLRLARAARRRGIPTVHVVCPQVWAWRRGRIPAIARALDRLLVFLPFEPDCFRGVDLKVTFVGHPLVDRVRETREAPPPELPWPGSPRLALLPGSRANEIHRLLPDMLESARRIRRTHPKAGFLIPAAEASARRNIEQVLAGKNDLLGAVGIVDGGARPVLLQARAALAASGTATLEACLLDCPTVVVYRVAWSTYCLGRCLVRGVDHISLPNIVAGREVFPELIQRRFTAAEAAERLLELVGDTPERRRMREGMHAVEKALGPGHIDEAAARAILETLAERGTGGPPPAISTKGVAEG